MRQILFTFFGEPIYSYPLLMGIGWGVGFNVAKNNWLAQGYLVKDLYKIFLGIFISAWVGAKVFFLIFSTPESMANYFVEKSFWLGGGFVFYGGLTFSILFLWLYGLRSTSFKFIDVSLFVPAIFIAHAIGRVGCYLAGCCYGDQCPLDFIDRYPVQLYEAFLLLCLYLVSKYFLLRKEDKQSTILTYLLGYSTCRFLIEFLRDDSIRGIYWGLSTSQWVSIVLFFCGCFYFFRRRLI